MEYAGYVASFAMGILLGIIGGGGSILTVPILIYLFGFSALSATGHSLFVVGTTSLIGSLLYVRRREVDFKMALTFALPGIAGVNISRTVILPSLPETVLNFSGIPVTKDMLILTVFAILMVTSSYLMIKKSGPQATLQTTAAKRTALMASIGLAVGLIAGFVGAGGGFLIIPSLVFMAALPMRTAIGTSLMIISWQSLLGFAGDVAQGMAIQWPLLATVSVLAVGGITIGAATAHKVKESWLKTAFGWFVLLIGSFILIEQFRHLSF